MITTLLIIHGLLAVALLGAVTHQALSVWWPARAGARGFGASFRAVRGAAYTNAIVALYTVTAVVGGVLLYPTYRLTVRVLLNQLRLNAANGVFEFKEHLVAIGLGLLPAYWYYWRQPLAAEHAGVRRALTAILALIVWWSFLVGHVLNNIRGFGL
jgi:hypothetical protein